jgi:hypothetical protein
VSDRSIIAILPAVSLGFIAGLITSMAQLEPGPTWIVGIAGAVLVALAATSSVFGVRAEAGEKAIVGVLRAACAVALYGCMFLFILKFLRDGAILASLPWVVLGIAFGLVLSRLHVRDREETSGAQTATE